MLGRRLIKTELQALCLIGLVSLAGLAHFGRADDSAPPETVIKLDDGTKQTRAIPAPAKQKLSFAGLFKEVLSKMGANNLSKGGYFKALLTAQEPPEQNGADGPLSTVSSIIVVAKGRRSPQRINTDYQFTQLIN